MKNRQNIVQSLHLAILALVVLPWAFVQTAAAADKGHEGHALMCEKCKTVWVSSPAPSAGGGGAKGGSGYTVYRQEKSMECKECESHAAAFFKTGKMEMDCKTCGSAMTHCMAH